MLMFPLAVLHMRQLRQASSQGYSLLGRSHDNIHGSLSSPRYYQPHPAPRREPLRRYASAQTLPHSTGFQPGYHTASGAVTPPPPVYRISGDFDSMWDRQHQQQAVHKPVFGQGITWYLLDSICMSDLFATASWLPCSNTSLSSKFLLIIGKL